MTFLHVSDLHIGKKLCGKPLMEDQKHILHEILDMAAAPDVDAVLIAGDLYDKSQPSGEAVEASGAFLAALSRLNRPVFVISGNHDCPEQVSYCAPILAGANVHVSPAFTGAPAPVALRDAYGELRVYLLPFVRPSQVRRALPERAGEIRSYADALRVIVEEMHIDVRVRNVLLAHQFVTGGAAVLTDSEERMVGGVDEVPWEVFRDFDYVALGHLHAPQRAGSDRILYAGSPLKYSQSEESQKKAALKVTLGEKGDFRVEALPYHPLRDVRSVKGQLRDLTREETPDRDYVFATLTDEVPPLDPMGTLLQRYPNLVQLRRENSRTGGKVETIAERVEERNPLEHFTAFFAAQNNGQMPTPGQMALMKKIIEEAEVKSGASH